jgi:hypothetical protein
MRRDKESTLKKDKKGNNQNKKIWRKVYLLEINLQEKVIQKSSRILKLDLKYQILLLTQVLLALEYKKIIKFCFITYLKREIFAYF